MERARLPRTRRCDRCGWISAAGATECVSCEKGPRAKRARAAKPPPSFRPWRCVVLAIDPGESSGWSVWSCGELIDHGETSIYSDQGVAAVVRAVDVARELASRISVPWVAWLEIAWGGRMAIGAGRAAGYWTFALRNAQLPRARIGEVFPATWRARVLPRGSHAALREVARAREVAAARSIANVATVGDDEAPAILIGSWAARAGETAEMLPRTLRVTVEDGGS